MNVDLSENEIKQMLEYIYSMEEECNFSKSYLYLNKAEKGIDKLQELVK